MKTNKQFNGSFKTSLQRAAGLLLLSLLAANPLSGFSQGVIDTDTTSGVNLNSTFSPAIHTVTVNSGVTVDNSDSGNDAISGDSRPWHLINNGTLNGFYDGVYFTLGGSVNNTASIYGGDDGIYIYGNAGAVVNSGSITGDNYDGIYFGNGGSVNNLFGGTITGNGYNNDSHASVEIYGGLGLVNNAGTIQSSSGLDAIYMDQGGSVTNSGDIYGSYNGVSISGSPASVVNSGYLRGYNSDGVRLGQGGSVDNSGSIYGYNNGVNIQGGSGSVVNSGYIEGYNSDGVYLAQGGSVSNTGSIYGNYHGVNIYGGTGSVVNGDATILGYNSDGVYMDQAGSVDNSGGIYGYYNGVYINGPGSVVNNGSIYGGYNYNNNNAVPNLFGPINQDNAGVYLNAGGVVINNGSIYGAYDIGSSSGVYITGGAGYVTNSGYIYGYGADGVDLNAGGVVNNTTYGYIGGDVNGVLINGPATVINDGGYYGEGNGGIYGYGGAGVYLTQGGSVANSGIIYGYYDGVDVYGNPGSVVNSGNITGNNGDGVYMDLGGTVTNNSYGNISGAQNGVAIVGNAGSVYNNGTITGTANDGVLLGAGGNVYNDYYGSITGGQNGVVITNGSGYVENYGSITGQNGDGVQLHVGGTVYNGNYYNDYSSVNSHSQSFSPSYYYGYAMIAGAQNGVNITGDAGYVYNYYGSITGVNNDGVLLGAGGEVYNYDYYGAISGGQNGVSITGGNGYVYNYGTIIGTNNDGVLLGAGGNVYNDYYATISGGQNGVEITNSTLIFQTAAPRIAEAPSYAVYNNGAITGTANNGVYINLGADSSVYNDYYGTISGGQNGVNITNGLGTVVNAGTITGTNRDGVYLGGGGSVNNTATGIISGGGDGSEAANAGVRIDGGDGAVVNAGLISGAYNGITIYSNGVVNNLSGGSITGSGSDGWGVRIDGNGFVTNAANGLIAGTERGISIGGSGIVVNAGTIIGTNSEFGSSDGVYIGAGGSVNNAATGTIIGGDNGVEIVGGDGIVVNAGTIIGHGGTSILLDNYNNSVTLQTGSHLVGDVYGGTANDALILQGTGTDVNNFYNFETLTVQADAWDGHTNGWNLTGNSTFTTNTTVETGLLRVNGTLTTPLVEVETNGVLGGSGTIYGIVDIHGILAPGNSPGTLTIIGSLTNGADYHAQVNADGTHDLTVVSDTATITGGDVVVQLEHKIYGSSTNVILTATNGVSGTYVTSYFDTNSAVPIFLAQSLQYDPNNVYLALNRSPFVSVAKTFNQTAVAKTLDAVEDAARLGTAPGISNVVSEMFWMPSAAAAQKAMDSMSGEIHGTVGLVEGQQQQLFSSLIERRMQGVRAGTAGGEMASDTDTNKNWGVWLQGFGMFGTLSSDGNAAGGDFNISGLSGGVEYKLNPSLTVGVSAGYAASDVTVGDRQSSGNVDSFQFAGYGNYTSGPWYLDGVFSYGHNDITTKRQISVGSIQELAKGSYNGDVLAVSAEGGYSIHCCEHWDLQPLVGLKYTTLMQDGFRETDATAGLAVNSVDMDSFRSTLGVRLAASFGKENGVQFMPQISARWEHEFMDLGADVNSQFLGGSPSMITRGVRLEAESGVLDAGFMVAFSKSVHAFAGYAATLNSHLTSQTVSGGVSYCW